MSPDHKATDSRADPGQNDRLRDTKSDGAYP